MKAVDHKYLVFIDLAYSNASATFKKLNDVWKFEIQTAARLTKELKFARMRLGYDHSPDMINSYGTNGTIIDNKSYSEGFNIDMCSADEMSRYIKENNQCISGIRLMSGGKTFLRM